MAFGFVSWHDLTVRWTGSVVWADSTSINLPWPADYVPSHGYDDTSPPLLGNTFQGLLLPQSLRIPTITIASTDSINSSICEAESWMIVSEIVLFVFWQAVPVISPALIPQPILAPDVQ
jgi:hypothetical protein